MHGLVLEGRVSSDDLIKFGLSQFTFKVVGHHTLYPSQRPSLVRAHCRNALSATVNPLTVGTPIRHFVMAITNQSTQLYEYTP